MNEFFTWELLASYAGASLATGIVTNFVKGAFKNLPTQILAYIIALVVLLAGNAYFGSLTLYSVVLSFLNAVIVATAASGSYDAYHRLKEGK